MALNFDLREFNLTDSDVERIKDFAACAENEAAIAGLKAALEAFESRTRDRIARQVEGENKV